MEKTKLDPKNLMTVANYARHKGCTRQTVYNHLKEGKVKMVDFLGQKFIDKSTEKK